jgi:hypothetical protein
MENKLITVECSGNKMAVTTHAGTWRENYSTIHSSLKKFKLELAVYYGNMIIMMVESELTPMALYDSFPKENSERLEDCYCLKDMGYIIEEKRHFHIPDYTIGCIFSPFKRGAKRKIVVSSNLIEMDIYLETSDHCDKRSFRLITSRCNFNGTLRDKKWR